MQKRSVTTARDDGVQSRGVRPDLLGVPHLDAAETTAHQGIPPALAIMTLHRCNVGGD